MSYAVVDVETTGISPRHHHRILEVAIVKLNHDGGIISSYTTLVNPNRDVGPTHIHGIHASDVMNAPQFEDIAGDIFDILADSTIVGHNIRFDWSFLQAESERHDWYLPDAPRICTVQLSKFLAPTGRRNLASVCDALGISLENAHSALEDAKATAEIFRKCLSSPEICQFIDQKIPKTTYGSWPIAPTSGYSITRQKSRIQKTSKGSSYIQKLVKQLPAQGINDTPEIEYLALLDEALCDRVITDEEAHELISAAKEMGMGLSQVEQLHRHYVRDLVHYALEDQVITERERRDLEDVANMLGVKHAELDKMIARTKEGDMLEELMYRGRDMKGKSVCFTGELRCMIGGERVTREIAHALAASKGMIIAKSVTKTCDYLVVADPHTQSTKAKRARSYGTPILAETAFWQMLELEVQ